jgi:hypothetical protein
LTYAGTYGRNERVPVERLLRGETRHPLGLRREEEVREEELGNRRYEVTALAAAEAEEAATANRKWTFGVAAGALLMAGTFAAGALGITGGAAPVAGAAPEHAPAAPGHAPGSGPVAGAPAPGQDDRQSPNQQQDPRSNLQTEPSSVTQKGGTPDRDLSSPTGESSSSGGSGNTGGSGGGSVDTPAPPVQEQPAPPQQQTPPAQQQQGPLGQVLTPVVDTADDVLSPVTDTVGGLLGVQSSESSTQRSATASGPALTMINPLGDLLGV